MSTRAAFTVPLVPPDVNHYVRHTRTGRHYVTKDATAFKQAVAIYGRNLFVCAKTFTVSIRIILPACKRGDADGFIKLVLDGMADAGIFRDRKGEIVSDAYVRCLCVMLDTDRRPKHGWTEIVVEALK